MSTSSAFWRCTQCGTPNPAAAYLTQCVSCGQKRPANKSVPEPAQDAPVKKKIRTRTPRWLLAFAMLSVAVVTVVLVVIRGSVGPVWIVAPLMFAPRWPWLAVPGAIGLLSLVMRRGKPLLISMLGLAIVAGPLMDLRVPWKRWVYAPPVGQVVRIMTFNGASHASNVERLRQVVAQERIDVLCFQELAADPILLAYLAEGWHVSRTGNVASRFPIRAEYGGMVQESLDAGRFVGQFTRVRVALPNGREILLASVHLPTMRPGFEGLLEKQADAIDMIWPWWDRQMGRVLDHLKETPELPFLAGGDWNMPTEHPRFRAHADTVSLAFDEAGFGYGYTRPARRSWVRIDHVLASPEWTFTRCWVGPDLGSDHLPVIAEAVLAPAQEMPR